MLSVLVVGSFILGATSLQDFGLALVIGLTSGAYSSIFIASPLLAMMKEREPRYITIRQRLEARGDAGPVLTPAAAAAMAGAAGAERSGLGPGPQPDHRGHPPGAGISARRRVGSRPEDGGGRRRAGGRRRGGVGPGGSRTSSGGGRAASGSTRPAGTARPPSPQGKGRKGGKGKRR